MKHILTGSAKIVVMERVLIPVIFTFFCSLSASSATAEVEVTVLTQIPKLLRTWNPEEIREFARKGRFTSQKFIFDESAKTMELNERADIDLLTVYGKDAAGKPKVARVPRFMVWRDAFKLSFDFKKGQLSSRATPTQLKIPLDLFDIRDINKIELSQHGMTYPGTRLKVRTNPAASRGEKLFTQNCLACHSFSHPIDPTQLSPDMLKAFAPKHSGFPGLAIDARDSRGLTAYGEALASEKSKVDSAK